jgi:hypothetical protein
MKLELGLDVLRSYKRLPYSPWHALAEFVDNSTQSYFNNEDVLNYAYEQEGSPLEVSIVFDKEGEGLIRISDNAMGMDHEELTKALRVGLPPDNAEGRSRYGLGMKMAACWYGNKWKIVTKKLGETTEYTVEIDVEKVANGDADLAESQVDGLDPTTHYTRIDITDLNRKPQGRTITKIKDFLGGMYRLDIDAGQLRLMWQHDPLHWDPDWVFLKDPLGGEYRKEFVFDVNGKVAVGWVGVLEQGGRQKAGFAVVHKRRMVRTWPDAWHPETLFGQAQGSNDLVNQRLVGEIYLDDFDVSHTKDDIHWMDDEEDQVQDLLQEACAEYREVAKRTRKGRRLAEAAVQAAAREIEAELQSPEMQDIIEQDIPAPEAVAADDEALVAETDVAAADFRAEIPGSVPVEVIGILDTTKSPNDPYVISESSSADRVIVVINMNHPHLGQIDENGLLNYFRHCTYDALAEWKALHQAQSLDPGTIRRLKDGLLRVSLDISMHHD